MTRNIVFFIPLAMKFIKALDDFLQHCVDAGCLDDVARIGGRSTAESQELQSCNLRTPWQCLDDWSVVTGT